MYKSLVDDDFIKYVLDKYSDMVFRIARQYLKNKQDAEDITQEVFLSLVKQQNFNDEQHLKAWLIRTTINKSINLCKCNSRKNAAERPLEVFDNLSNSTSAQTYGIGEALDKLSAEDKTIIYLHYYEGYSAKEIAPLINLREKAVAKRLSRSREKLKGFLSEGESND